VNDANGGVGAPDDSRRLQQGRVKIQDLATDKVAKHIKARGPFTDR
jgi:hypothetical protein